MTDTDQAVPAPRKARSNKVGSANVGASSTHKTHRKVVSEKDAPVPQSWAQDDGSKPAIFLALQGGGAKGIVHVGAITAIHDLDFVLKGVAGTSAGSIVAALISAGYTPQELLDLDGTGNLFERLPPELGVRKPTDLFPRTGWLALKILRRTGRIIQCVVDLFSSRDETEGDGSEPRAKHSSPGNDARPINAHAKVKGVMGHSKAFARSILSIGKPTVLWLVAGSLLFGISYAAAPWLKHRAESTLMITIWVGLLLLLTVGVIVWRLIAGITNVDKVRDFIHHALLQKVKASNPSVGVTFDDLRKAQRPPLKIVATNVNAECLELFCVERTPRVAVADAVAASICIPVIFRPWRLRFYRGRDEQAPLVDTRFLDGGLVSNLPAWPFDAEREASPGIATVALSIGEPPEPTEKPWLISLIGAVVNGSKEVHTRAAGRISQIALKTELDMLEFDAPVKKLRQQANAARGLSQMQLIDDFYAMSHVVPRFMGAVHSALADLQVNSMMHWSTIDPPYSELRVSLALQSLSHLRRFDVLHTAGIEDRPGEVDPLKRGHPALKAWAKQKDFFEELDGISVYDLAHRGLWPEAKYVLCIPIQMSTSKDESTEQSDARGCVLIIESNAAIDSANDIARSAFELFVETAKAAVLKLEYQSTPNKKIKLADFVQRDIKWQK